MGHGREGSPLNGRAVLFQNEWSSGGGDRFPCRGFIPAHWPQIAREDSDKEDERNRCRRQVQSPPVAKGIKKQFEIFTRDHKKPLASLPPVVGVISVRRG